MIVIKLTVEDLRDQNPEYAMDEIHQEKKLTTLRGGVSARNIQTKAIDIDKKI